MIVRKTSCSWQLGCALSVAAVIAAVFVVHPARAVDLLRYDSTGTFNITSTSTVGGNIHIFARNTGTGLFVASSTNNIGIGTASPAAKLHVAGGTSGNILLDNQGILYGKDTGGTARAAFYPRWSNDATYIDGGTGGMYLRTNDAGATNMYLATSGNVGIATTNPTSTLTVSGQLSMLNNRITNVATPISNSDSATKSYVDSVAGSGLTGTGAASYIAKWTGTGSFGTSTLYESSGNVGVGTTGPTHKLDVVDVASSSLIYPLSISNLTITTSTPPGTAIKFGLSDSGTAISHFSYVGALKEGTWLNGWDRGTNLVFGTHQQGVGLAERMRITGGGNVGIATTNPTSTLTVSGQLSMLNNRITNVATPISNSDSATKSYVDSTFGGGSSTSSFATLTVSATTTLATGGTANVGIGTTSPGATLDMRGDGNSADRTNIGLLRTFTTQSLAADVGSSISFGGKYTAGGSFGDWAMVRGYKDNATDGDYAGYMALATRANGASMAERVRITSGGNVGIGTTTPLFKTQVSGALNSGGGAFLSQPSTARADYWDTSGTSSPFQPNLMVRSDSTATTLNTTPTALVVYNSNGANNNWAKIGFAMNEATASSNPVAIAGIAAEKTAGTAGNWASGDVVLWTKNGSSAVEVMRGTSGGNVGIATTAPKTKLDISGGLSVSGRASIHGTQTNGGFKRYVPYGALAAPRELTAQGSQAIASVTTNDGTITSNNTNNSWDWGWTGPGYSRLAGRTVEFTIDTTGANNQADHFMIGWGNGTSMGTSTDYTYLNHALYWNKSNGGAFTIQVYENGSDKGVSYTATWGDTIHGRIVLRSTGAYYYIKKNNNPNWELFYTNTTDTTATLYPQLAGYAGRFTVYDWNVYDQENLVYSVGNSYLALDSGNVGIGTTSPTSTLAVAGNISVNNNRVINLAVPVGNSDAANKSYVDAAVGEGSAYTSKAIKIYPINAAGGSVSGNSTDEAWSSWTEFMAANTITSDFIITGISVEAAGSTSVGDYVWLVDLGKGGAGAETSIASVSGAVDWDSEVGTFNSNTHYTLPIPVKVAANSRLAFRAKTNTYNSSETMSMSVHVQYIELPL